VKLSHAVDLSTLGWVSPDQETAFEPYGAAGLAAGRVGAHHRGGYVVYSQLGELLGVLPGRLRSAAPGELPAVGDWVAFRPLDGAAALVEAVLPRRTCFRRSRRDLARGSNVGEEQVVAANVDVVFLVADLSVPGSPRSLERYLAAAWESGAEPVVVLTKLDLCADPAARVAEAQHVGLGVPVQAVSAATGEGVEAIRALLAGNRTAALLGPSGAGKSTLVNRLLGREAQATRALRSDGRGRHTTTARELFLVPGGGLVLDTPGLRVLQLWDDDGLHGAFADLDDLARQCRFSDCRHETEPGCAVRAAVEDGLLDGERLQSWAKLGRELAYLERKGDRRAEAEERRRWRAVTKEGRARQRHRSRQPGRNDPRR
jgi:ribosome biogenesis GTPase